MKQIILPFNTGKPELIEIPAPVVQPGEVLIRNTVSVISTGTEQMLMNFGKASIIGKALQQPERVAQVLSKIKTDGLKSALAAVRSKLDKPIALGYSSAGIVIAAGSGISDIRPGDRVASNGPHAEIVSVPRNLVAKIPDGVGDEDAAFTVLGAIALQGIRLAAPTFGETVVVIGLGLIGQLTAQLLLANGCRVIGADLHGARLSLAESCGVQVLAEAGGASVRALTAGYGADAVIITASSDSNGILDLAADMCRKRGRIVLTGVTGMKLSREAFFKKELSFQVSASYGPGRYEPRYERDGLDYPIGYVRWTEGRNFEAVLAAMASGRLNVQRLITVRRRLEDFATLYDLLQDPEQIAGIITYSGTADASAYRLIAGKPGIAAGAGIGIIGAGNFASGMLLPALKSAGGNVQAIVSKNGVSATLLAQKYDIPFAGTDYTRLLSDGAIGAIVIATPHNTHASIAEACLLAGKHVFVEKPLALFRKECSGVAAALGLSGPSLTVGFNRRFAPFAINARTLLERLGGPVNIVVTVNAGLLPQAHWLADAAIGGGRILGEACHFIDLCAYFSDSHIVAVCANGIPGGGDTPIEDASILLRFANGSSAVINYFSNGAKAYDKERIELYCAGHTIIIENWRVLRSYGFRKDISLKAAQDKGNRALIALWVKSLEGTRLPIAPDAIFNSTLATIAAVESLTAPGWVAV